VLYESVIDIDVDNSDSTLLQYSNKKIAVGYYIALFCSFT